MNETRKVPESAAAAAAAADLGTDVYGRRPMENEGITVVAVTAPPSRGRSPASAADDTGEDDDDDGGGGDNGRRRHFSRAFRRVHLPLADATKTAARTREQADALQHRHRHTHTHTRGSSAPTHSHRDTHTHTGTIKASKRGHNKRRNKKTPQRQVVRAPSVRRLSQLTTALQLTGPAGRTDRRKQGATTAAVASAISRSPRQPRRESKAAVDYFT